LLIVAAVAAMVAVGGVLASGVLHQGTDYEGRTVTLIDHLDRGEYDEVFEMFDDTMKEDPSAKNLQATWEEHILSNYGQFGTIEEIDYTDQTPYRIAQAYCHFMYGGLCITVVYNIGGTVAGLFFGPWNTDDDMNLPEGLKESDVLINKGTEWELAGKLTGLTGGITGTAAVLVHGSGPSDMDETIYTNKPFRDLAWGLAESGIDVLRYDKRTYAHGAAMASMDKLTVEEETIQDAIAAGVMLREMGYENVYLIGHSMGGMLAPRILEECPGTFDGFVSMAGSPRTLTEIIIDQNRAAIEELEGEQREYYEGLIEAEIGKLDLMDRWTEQELLSNTVFSLPAYYVKEMNSHDAAEAARGLDVPMLFVQGSADFQVSVEKDYEAWRDAMKGESSAGFILYPGLNHLFMVSQGDDAGTLREYAQKGTVSNTVIEDIAEFILG